MQVAIFTIGLVKKLVFADQIATVVDAAYKADVINAPTAWLAIYGFSMQIYCDFSGYTDMAIGIALIIGVRLPNNFLRPDGATSLIDFGVDGTSRFRFGCAIISTFRCGRQPRRAAATMSI